MYSSLFPLFLNDKCSIYAVMQLRAVGHVAVLGGMLQIIIFMFLCGITAVVSIFGFNGNVQGLSFTLQRVFKASLSMFFRFVEESCQRECLLVLFYQCHLQQWYFSVTILLLDYFSFGLPLVLQSFLLDFFSLGCEVFGGKKL